MRNIIEDEAFTEHSMETIARRGIQSVEVTARVLETLTRARAPMTLSSLARAAGLPPSKAHRYLVSLIDANLVRQDERSSHYDLGPAAIALGIAAISRSDPVNAAADALRALSVETRTTAMLSVWADHGPTVVRWERSAAVLVTSLGLGSVLPLLSSATGQVFLACLPHAVTEQILATEVKAGSRNPMTKSDIDALRAKTRKAGYATVDGHLIPGLHAIAAPVLNWQGEPDAVITLISAAGTTNADAHNETRHALMEACRDLSRTAEDTPDICPPDRSRSSLD